MSGEDMAVAALTKLASGIDEGNQVLKFYFNEPLLFETHINLLINVKTYTYLPTITILAYLLRFLNAYSELRICVIKLRCLCIY